MSLMYAGQVSSKQHWSSSTFWRVIDGYEEAGGRGGSVHMGDLVVP